MNNPKTLEDVKKIVLAGMKLLYDPKTAQMRSMIIKSTGASAEKLASNVVGIMKIMWEKSKGTLPPEAIGPATTILIYELASFLKEAGKPMDQAEVEDAVPLAMEMIKELFTQLHAKGGAAPQPDQPQPQPQAAPQGLLAAQGA